MNAVLNSVKSNYNVILSSLLGVISISILSLTQYNNSTPSLIWFAVNIIIMRWIIKKEKKNIWLLFLFTTIVSILTTIMPLAAIGCIIYWLLFMYSYAKSMTGLGMSIFFTSFFWVLWCWLNLGMELGQL